ncbi:MAG TPA: HIT domain-containing protein [Chloroflexota bacterium]|nr:HIT domain-containing protein [Chloroflexota bacterium]
MEQLWAPWRMHYIQSGDEATGCLFCEAASAADERHYVVHRGLQCLVMLNLYPYNSGHLMVAPYQHTGEIAALRPEVGADVFHTAQLAVRVLDEVMHPQGFNLGVNQGEPAGAGIADHIHLHVVPRWGGDTNFMPVLADTKVMPELLVTTAERLRPVFQRLSAE